MKKTRACETRRRGRSSLQIYCCCPPSEASPVIRAENLLFGTKAEDWFVQSRGTALLYVPSVSHSYLTFLKNGRLFWAYIRLLHGSCHRVAGAHCCTPGAGLRWKGSMLKKTYLTDHSNTSRSFRGMRRAATWSDKTRADERYCQLGLNVSDVQAPLLKRARTSEFWHMGVQKEIKAE
jgi:hypothetical protein